MYIIIPNSYRKILKDNKIEKVAWRNDGKFEIVTPKEKRWNFVMDDLFFHELKLIEWKLLKLNQIQIFYSTQNVISTQKLFNFSSVLDKFLHMEKLKKSKTGWALQHKLFLLFTKMISFWVKMSYYFKTQIHYFYWLLIYYLFIICYE